MKKVVKYIPIDPYYNEFTETYIGGSASEIENIQYETEDFISREHASLGMIYKTEIILDETTSYGSN
jgi:hypothetical protein